LDLGKTNEKVVGLCADLTESTRMQDFADAFPERFFEMGVAEQNLATVAAGLGVSGKIPFIASYATFSPGRNYEQIRTTLCYNDANVKIIGAHAGISVGPDGATHQATEDVAIMRVLPNMRVFCPCDGIEAEKITKAAAEIWGPVYIRLTREKTPTITSGETPFTPGKMETFFETPLRGKKKKVAIIACGPIMWHALRAAEKLEKKKIGVAVYNLHTIKPIDEKKIVAVGKKYGAIVTVEEHQIRGGMGSAVAEVLAKHHPVPVEFVGLDDTFGESGAPGELLKKYGMDTENILDAAERLLRRKES
jgi:transketolase